MYHGESNKGPASPRTTNTTAQSKPPTNQPSHTQTANEQHYKFVHQPPTHHTHQPALPNPINPQVTAHQRSIPQATHAHPRPRQSAHNNTAPILHTHVQARQGLNHHGIACTQHTAKRLTWYKRRMNRAPPLPPYTGSAPRAPEGRVRGGEGEGGASNASSVPQTLAREPRPEGGKGGESRGTAVARKRQGRGGRRREWSTHRGDSSGGGQPPARIAFTCTLTRKNAWLHVWHPIKGHPLAQAVREGLSCRPSAPALAAAGAMQFS